MAITFGTTLYHNLGAFDCKLVLFCEGLFSVNGFFHEAIKSFWRKNAIMSQIRYRNKQ